MIAGLIAVGVIAANYIYQELKEEKRPLRMGPQLQTPHTEPGTPIAKVFGRVRVRQPILAWTGNLQFVDVSGANGAYRVYALDMLFVAGIPMGSGTTRGGSLSGPKLHNVWWGDYKLPSPGRLPLLDGVNTFYGQNITRPLQFGGPGKGGGLRGAYYWHGGWTDQLFTTPASRIGDRMFASIGNNNRIPGLAKQMCVSFVKMVEDGADPYINSTYPDAGGSVESVPYPGQGFVYGENNSITSVSLEVSSYGDVVSGVTQHRFAMSQEGVDFGGDADPAEVIYCMATDTFGGLGIPASRIDTTSFMASSTTLKQENHGYSRYEHSGRDAGECIRDVLDQTDGVLRDNPKTGLVEYKLIRPDYDPNAIPHITKYNCMKLEAGAAGGWTNIPNAVRVGFTNRDKEYEEDSVLAQNNANAVGQDGQVILQTVSFPGCTRLAHAKELAARELAWRSRPMMKFRAIVDRSFIDVLQGDAVMVTWVKPDVAGLVFRVADVDHGPLGSATIALDLVQDFFWVWRKQPPKVPHYGLPGIRLNGLNVR